MKAKNIALCGMFSALLALCAWLSLPMGDTSVSLQTFGVFLSLFVLGGKRGSIAIFVYLLLGVAGLPVFSGFRGGLGALLSPTGGYLAGFLACGLTYWLLTAHLPKRQLQAMLTGLAVCYLLGSLWYYIVYTQRGSAVALGLVLVKCVLPFLLPDGLKLFLAWQLHKKLKPFVY